MSDMKTRLCPMCGDMVRADSDECSRCGETLSIKPKPVDPWRYTRMATSWKATELHLAEQSSRHADEKKNTCLACGQVVNAGLRQCPLCGEALERKISGAGQKSRVMMSLNRKAAIHLAENSPKRSRINNCPTCGEIVKTSWGECPTCGASLEEVMAFPGLWYENPQAANQAIVQSGGDESTNKKVKISTCTLCGDMVREDWQECPRCGESLSKDKTT